MAGSMTLRRMVAEIEVFMRSSLAFLNLSFMAHAHKALDHPDGNEVFLHRGIEVVDLGLHNLKR